MAIENTIVLTFTIAAYLVWFRCTLSYLELFVIERKIYNNLFRILTFAKPSCDNLLQPSPLATHYHTRAWQTLIYGKECFIFIDALIRICNVIIFGIHFKEMEFKVFIFVKYR